MVTGSREVSAKDILCVERHLERLDPDIAFLILGDARGVDTVAWRWAEKKGYVSRDLVERYFADWDLYGKKAGVIRNGMMVDDGKPDLVIAFPHRRSIGTWHAIRYAADRGINVEIYPLPPDSQPRADHHIPTPD